MKVPIKLVSRFFLMTLPLITMLASFFPNIVYGQAGTNGTEQQYQVCLVRAASVLKTKGCLGNR